MSHPKISAHELTMCLARATGGHWLLEPVWLLHNTDLLARMEKGEDMGNVWPKMQPQNLVLEDGAWQVAATAAVDTAAAQSSSGSGISSGKSIGVIQISGPVMKYGWNSSKALRQYLSIMARDPQVGGVKLVFDSPGGQNAGTREVYQDILNFPKPVLSLVDGTMASAAYYMAAGSKKIVATQPTNQIGSIGTYATYMDLMAYYESLGLPVYQIYAPESTEKNQAIRELFSSKGKDNKKVLAELSLVNQQFLADVKEGRKGALNAKAGHRGSGDPLKGAIYFAQEAKSVGLIDELIDEGQSNDLLADMIVTQTQTSYQMKGLDKFKQGLESLFNEVFGQSEETTTPAEAPQTTPQSEATQTAAPATPAAAPAAASTTPSVEQLQATIQQLTKERDEANQKAEQFGSQPGAMPTQVAKPADKIEDTGKTLEQFMEGLESTQLAKSMGLM